MKTLRLQEGILGGIAAGIVMAMVAMMYTLVTQGDLLAPLEQMGALFFPTDSGSAVSLIAGLMLHMMSTAIFGAVFVLLARSISMLTGFAALSLAAMAYIVVEWAVAAFVVLPAVDRPLLATFATIGGFVAHAMYGLALAAWLVWRTAPATYAAHAGTQQHRIA